MNFHSKNWQKCQALENSKNSIGSRIPGERYNGTNLCFLGIKMPERVLTRRELKELSSKLTF